MCHRHTLSIRLERNKSKALEPVLKQTRQLIPSKRPSGEDAIAESLD